MPAPCLSSSRSAPLPPITPWSWPATPPACKSTPSLRSLPSTHPTTYRPPSPTTAPSAAPPTYPSMSTGWPARPTRASLLSNISRPCRSCPILPASSLPTRIFTSFSAWSISPRANSTSSPDPTKCVWPAWSWAATQPSVQPTISCPNSTSRCARVSKRATSAAPWIASSKRVAL